MIDSKQTDWTTEWPTEEGLYWFYGYTTKWEAKPEADEPRRLLSVRAVDDGKGNIHTMGAAEFIFKTEATGHWVRAWVPDLPLGEIVG